MTTIYASYPVTGGGSVPTYANLAAFPAASSAGNGALAIALDTNYLYESDGASWVVIASPAMGSAITALTGDVTATGPGSVPATVAWVGASSASDVHASVLDTQAATALNTAATIVKRDGSGNFAAGTITATLTGAASLNLLKASNLSDVASTTTSFNNISPTTTKGDLIAYSTTNARLPVGSNTQVLTADSAQTLGVKWATPTTGTVTSVDMTVPSLLSVSGNPITTSGTLAVTYSGTALPIANGGTGLTSGTSGGILGYTASGTLASSGALTANAIVLGGGAGATPTVLGSLGTTTTVLHGNAAGAPTFGAVSLTADVSGALPLVNGGTGTAAGSANVAFNALSPLTTKGDIVAYSTVNARLAAGSNGQILTAQSGQTAGLLWASTSALTTATPTVQGVVTSYSPTVSASVKTLSSAGYVILDTDGFTDFVMTTGASDRTLTLPSAANNAGRMLNVVKVDTGAGFVIMTAAGGDSIDGAASQYIMARYDRTILVSDGGTNWYMLVAAPEYAWNSSTNNGNDTTSFGWGPGGVQFISLTAAANKTVQFKTNIDPTDKIFLQASFDTGVTWGDIGQFEEGSASRYQMQTTTSYGMQYSHDTANTVSVNFGTYRTLGTSTYGAAGTAWSGVGANATYVWRVRRLR